MVEQPAPPEGDTTDLAIGDGLALEVLEPGVPIPAYIVPDAQVGTFPDFGFAPAPSAEGITAPSSELDHDNWDWNGYVVMMSAALDSGTTLTPTPTPTPTPHRRPHRPHRYCRSCGFRPLGPWLSGTTR